MAFNTTLVPAHILPDVTDIVGFTIAFTVKVAVLVQFPTEPTTVTIPFNPPLLDVPIMVEPFNVLAVKPFIGPHVYVLAPFAVKDTVLGEPL